MGLSEARKLPDKLEYLNQKDKKKIRKDFIFRGV
jgi:hypothetical protein